MSAQVKGSGSKWYDVTVTFTTPMMILRTMYVTVRHITMLWHVQALCSSGPHLPGHPKAPERQGMRGLSRGKVPETQKRRIH